MTVIRTVVVTLPRIISDIVERLLTDGIELDICARLETRERIEETLQAVVPDLVLTGLAPGESAAIVASVATMLPDATIIAFTGDGRSAHVAVRRVVSAPIVDLTVEAIIKVIRCIEPQDLDRPSRI